MVQASPDLQTCPNRTEWSTQMPVRVAPLNRQIADLPESVATAKGCANQGNLLK